MQLRNGITVLDQNVVITATHINNPTIESNTIVKIIEKTKQIIQKLNIQTIEPIICSPIIQNPTHPTLTLDKFTPNEICINNLISKM